MTSTVASAANAPARRSKPALYLQLARPFTLLPPLLGIISGAVCAWGSVHNPDPQRNLTLSVVLTVALGSLCASFMNAASNALNQIYDLAIDRVNKPARPLPSGRLTIREAWIFTWITYAIALVLAWFVAPGGRHECFWIVLIAAILTFAYSVPPFRTKRHGLWANVTIAVPRGLLLKVAGWSAVKTVVGVEPWFIGSIFGLFLLGASTTKDFSDMEGDRADGCRTLPIIYGVRRAAWMISPSFILPFLLINVGVLTGVLTGNPVLLHALGITMTIYGAYVLYLMLRRPEELAVDANHVSWAHMYRMMFVAQIGFALAYLV